MIHIGIKRHYTIVDIGLEYISTCKKIYLEEINIFFYLSVNYLFSIQPVGLVESSKNG